MDAETFDRLVLALTNVRSRRGLLSLLAGIPLASTIATRLGDEAVAQGRTAHRHRAPHQHRHATTHPRTGQRHDSHSEACIPTGQRCPSKKPRGKHAKKLGCNQCCQGSVVTDAAGKKVCGCQPNGGSCTSDTASSCCSGFCDDLTCQIPPSAPCDRTCTGCCAGGLCQPGTSLLACGTGGGNCTTCTGTGVTCGGGGTAGVCGCTAQPAAVTCTGQCGTVVQNNCGQDVTCSPCPPTITAFTASPTTIDRGATPPEES